MITSFHRIASDNIDLKVDFTKDLTLPGIDGLQNYDKSMRMKFATARSRGIKWMVNEKEYKIFAEGMDITGMVTPDFQKIVIVYPLEHPEFQPPHNAVVYNEDGSVYMTLNCPEPVSEMGRQRKRHMNYNSPQRLYFAGAVWAKNEKGNWVLGINIGFDVEYFETRELNHITGAFGPCLNSWRM